VSVDDTEAIGGVSWQDFVTLCEDWDIPDGNSSTMDIELDVEEPEKDTFDVFDDNSWELQTDTRPAKASDLLFFQSYILMSARSTRHPTQVPGH